MDIQPAPLHIPLRPVPFVMNLIVALGLFCGAGGLGVLAGAESIGSAVLTSVGETHTAKVTDSRVMSARKTGKSYELRYRLKLPSGAVVTASDFTGRQDLWVSLPKADWDQAVRQGTLAVQVVPQHPSLNAPVAGRMNDIGDLLAGFVMAGLLALCGLAVAWTAWKRRPRQGYSAPPPSA